MEISNIILKDKHKLKSKFVNIYKIVNFSKSNLYKAHFNQKKTLAKNQKKKKKIFELEAFFFIRSYVSKIVALIFGFYS